MSSKTPKSLKRLAIAFAVALVATGIYIGFLDAHTNEARTRVKLESTQSQLIKTKQDLIKKEATSKEDAAKQLQQIDELNKKLKETQDQLQAKRQANTAVAMTFSAQKSYPMPEDAAKAFIYSHESGNAPCKINGGAVDCNYNGNRACGLGQALPCQKLTVNCSLADYACQDVWFTNYMKGHYGTWSNAVAFWNSHRWW